MAISIFPSTAAEFVSNNFVIDMNDTSNNTADTGGVKQAGPYSISFSSGDSSFDVYFVDSDGNSVGYSNTTSIVATGLFTTVVIFGVAQDEVISFQYQGSVNNADGEGDEPGAGAYLESISPTDLPSIDDTATVTGGNFGADTEITFESGATVLPAKSITVVSGTELLVTRPDGLVEDDSPYDLKAINTGVTPPSSIDFVLTDAVTAGSDPTWVTTSPLDAGSPGNAFSQTLEATDSDGTVVDYSVTAGTITPGLSLDSSTGALSGTPTTGGNFTFTVTATDDGGNTTARQFTQSVEIATGGAVFDDGGFRYHKFNSTDTFETFESLSAEVLVVAGGGGAGQVGDAFSSTSSGGGGGGGVLTSTLSLDAATFNCVVGAGGAIDSNGADSSFTGQNTSLTAIGGGFGGVTGPGGDGGSGGGGGDDDNNQTSPGSGTSGQGNDGGQAVDLGGGGGGGAFETPGFISGSSKGQAGGLGSFSAFASPTNSGDGGRFAGGGGGGGNVDDTGDPDFYAGGVGGGGNGASRRSGNPPSTSGQTNTGGGGGGGAAINVDIADSSTGGSGIVIVRYAF